MSYTPRDNIDLMPVQLEIVVDLLMQHIPDTQVWAYGSRVTFQAHSESDLDMVAFSGESQQSDIDNLRKALGDSYLPFSVDLFVWNRIPDYFKPSIKEAYFVLQEGCNNNMAVIHHWKKHRLGDIVDINDGSWDENMGWKTLQYLDTENITSGIIDEIATFDARTNKIPTSARRLVKKNDIVYSTVRPRHRHFGVLGEVPDDLVVSTEFTVLRSKDPDKFLNHYIYYLITQKNITGHLQEIAENNNSTCPTLRPEDLLDLEFDFPPIAQQKSIVSLIRSIDDNIQLNHTMAQTLEELANTTFKSWFIDFDPVRAKAEGRPTGLTPEISDLFPDEFVESELGEIPKGWEMRPLAYLSHFRNGLALPKLPVVKIADKKEHSLQSFCALPDKSILNKASETIAPYIDRSIILQQEIRTLHALRNTYIRKIISGELDIPDAEEVLDGIE